MPPAPTRLRRAAAAARLRHRHRRTAHVLAHLLRPASRPTTATPPTSPVSPSALRSPSLPPSLALPPPHAALPPAPTSPDSSASASASASASPAPRAPPPAAPPSPLFPTPLTVAPPLSAPPHVAFSRLPPTHRAALTHALRARLRLARSVFPTGLHALSDAQMRARFRLSHPQLRRLAAAFDWPAPPARHPAGHPVTPHLATAALLLVSAAAPPAAAPLARDAPRLLGLDAAAAYAVAADAAAALRARAAHVVHNAHRLRQFAARYRRHSATAAVAVLGDALAGKPGQLVAAAVSPDGLFAAAAAPLPRDAAGRLYVRRRGGALRAALRDDLSVYATPRFVAAGISKQAPPARDATEQQQKLLQQRLPRTNSIASSTTANTATTTCADGLADEDMQCGVDDRRPSVDAAGVVRRAVDEARALWPGCGDDEDGWTIRLLLYNATLCLRAEGQSKSAAGDWECEPPSVEALFKVLHVSNSGPP